ncbi:BPSS1780 family membrane protein [Pelagibaculum spongiae]|uniref:DUF2189 domain-containing protein n=1 Tax=Pelagibaculum spongiae TaxID=2080658 RepID=A0A2V1H4J4_9GAMM|nr:BPSS1780 family membrane protein [Pelagibaculum spongiae]PVZ72148.1 hypothetical protein DC094_03805 [Pelagibaculum spongiae]
MSHQIEFTGKVREGFNRDEVKQHFASLNEGASNEMVSQLFSSTNSIVIKKELELKQAEVLIKKLANIGMECRISSLGKANFGARDTAAVQKKQPMSFDPIHNNGPVDPTRIASSQAKQQPTQQAAEQKQPFGGLSLEAKHEPEIQPQAEAPNMHSAAFNAQGTNNVSGQNFSQNNSQHHSQHNPYQSPSAPLQGFADDEENLYPPRNAGFASGVRWIAQGFGMFFQKPLGWIGCFLIYGIISVILAVIPVVNFFAAFFHVIFMAGFYAVAHQQKTENTLSIGELFSGFSKTGSLVFSMVIQSVGFIVVLAIAYGMADFGALATYAADSGMDIQNLSTADLIGLLWLFITPILVLSLLIIPIMMAGFYAPALIMLQDLSAPEALKQSFFGCLKNVHSLTLYSIIALILLIIGGSLLGLGLFVAVPVMLAASYMSYRDIFLHDNE